MGRLQPLLRQQRRGALLHPRPGRRHLRRPGPDRLVRPALRPRLGQRRRRLRGQRVPGDLPGRAARPRRDLLDRRRPARPARSSSATTRPWSAWATTSTGRRPCGTGPPRRWPAGVNLAFLGRQRLLPADPLRAVAARAQPTPGLLQVGGRGPDDRPERRPGHGQLAPTAGVPARSPADRQHLSGHRGRMPTWWSPIRPRGCSPGWTSLSANQLCPTWSQGEFDRYVPDRRRVRPTWT